MQCPHKCNFFKFSIHYSVLDKMLSKHHLRLADCFQNEEALVGNLIQESVLMKIQWKLHLSQLGAEQLLNLNQVFLHINLVFFIFVSCCEFLMNQSILKITVNRFDIFWFSNHFHPDLARWPWKWMVEIWVDLQLTHSIKKGKRTDCWCCNAVFMIANDLIARIREIF